jgi:tetratricopeptide (TPR) repeat protein
MRRRLGPICALSLLAGLALVLGCGNAKLTQAKKFQTEKNYEQAIQYYKLALDDDPENQTARYGLIETYAQQVIDQGAQKMTPEDVEKVMAELRPVSQPLMSDPNIKRNVSMIYQMLAKRYAEQGRHDLTAESWAKVIEIEPTFAEAHFNCGLALSLTGKNEDALPYFQKSVNLNPYFVKGYHAMGDALLKLARYEEAVQQYQKALELNPDDPTVHHNLGLTYFRSGNSEKAAVEYNRALEIEPNYALAYKSLHELYEKAGDKKKLAEIDAKWKEMTEKLLQAVREKQALSEQEKGAEGADAAKEL